MIRVVDSSSTAIGRSLPGIPPLRRTTRGGPTPYHSSMTASRLSSSGPVLRPDLTALLQDRRRRLDQALTAFDAVQSDALAVIAAVGRTVHNRVNAARHRERDTSMRRLHLVDRVFTDATLEARFMAFKRLGG